MRGNPEGDSISYKKKFTINQTDFDDGASPVKRRKQHG